MKLRNRALGALAAVLAVVTFAGAVSAADRPYTEGTVSVVSSIKVLPGKMDAYTSWLQTGWKKSMEAQKAAGIILGYAVYFTRARHPDDPDIYLVTTYKNMAAFDGLEDRVGPVAEQAMGMNQAQMSQAMADRGSMRTLIGTEVIREVVLK